MKQLFYTFFLCAFACSMLQAQNAVTLRVDMTDFIDDGGTVSGDGVHVAGTLSAASGIMDDWTPSQGAMTDMGENIWEIVLDMPDGDYEYKYINGNDWGDNENITSSDCGPGNGNRSMTVAGSDITEEFCYNKCTDCGVVAPTVSVTFNVDMTNMLARFGEPSLVSVAGAFQGWDPGATVMTDMDDDGVYTVKVDGVPQNSDFQFKYIFGDDWPYAESVPGACNEGGNRTFSTTDQDLVLDVVCFGSCDEDCPALGTPINVTFLVDLSNEIVSADGIHLAGTVQFPSWIKDTWEMTDVDGNGIYSIRVENVYPGEYQYKFINGDETAEEEMADFISLGCGVDNGVGGSNRVLDVSNSTSDEVVSFVYNTCTGVVPNTTDINNAAVVSLGASSTSNTSMITNYTLAPNPIQTEAVLNFDNPSNASFDFNLYDLNGRIVQSQLDITGSQIVINRNGLQTGLYFATLRDPQGGLLTIKVAVQ